MNFRDELLEKTKWKKGDTFTYYDREAEILSVTNDNILIYLSDEDEEIMLDYDELDGIKKHK